MIFHIFGPRARNVSVPNRTLRIMLIIKISLSWIHLKIDKFDIDCNIIINTTLMIKLFEKLHKCPNCGE